MRIRCILPHTPIANVSLGSLGDTRQHSLAKSQEPRAVQYVWRLCSSGKGYPRPVKTLELRKKEPSVNYLSHCLSLSTKGMNHNQCLEFLNGATTSLRVSRYMYSKVESNNWVEATEERCSVEEVRRGHNDFGIKRSERLFRSVLACVHTLLALCTYTDACLRSGVHSGLFERRIRRVINASFVLHYDSVSTLLAGAW